MTSSAATKSGNNVSMGVQLPEGTKNILKGITLMFEKIKILLINKSVSLLFCYTSYVLSHSRKLSVWSHVSSLLIL